MAELGEAGPGDQAHVARSEDGNAAHVCFCFCLRLTLRLLRRVEGLQALGDRDHRLVGQGVEQRVDHPVARVALAEHDHVQLPSAVVEVVAAPVDHAVQASALENGRVRPVHLLHAPVLQAALEDEPHGVVVLCDPVGAHRRVGVGRRRAVEHRRHHEVEADLVLLGADERDGGQPVAPDVGRCADDLLPRRRGRQRVVEGLPHDDREHRPVRKRPQVAAARLLERRAGALPARRIGNCLGRPEQPGHRDGGSAGSRLPAVVEHLRVELVVPRRIPGRVRSPLDRREASLGEEVPRLGGGTRDDVAVEHENRRVGRLRRGRLQLALQGDGGRDLGRLHVGAREPRDRVLDVRAFRRQLRVPGQPVDLLLEEVAALQPVGEERVAENRAWGQLAAAADTDLDVLRDGPDEARHLRQREAAAELLLHRRHEQLLAGHAVEVGVRVPVARVVERCAAGQPLVAGLEVDLRVAEPRADARVVVEVAPVDVHPDTVERVDDLLEAAEVDGDADS